jgi:hypothetical protein
MRKYSVGLSSFFALLLWSAAALATTQTGQVTATVRDTDGKPVAGVSLRLRSPDLQGARELKTGNDGQARFLQLPPGVYEVTATREEYAGGRVEKVAVNIGRTSAVEIVLVPLSSENVQEVVVTGAVSTVDTERVSLGASVGAQFLSDVPTDRQYQSIAALMPGVLGTGNPNSLGATEYANTYLLDGVDITDPVTHTFSTNFNFDQMKEVEVITGGRDAEYGGPPGVVINIVTKSGSNEHKVDGSLYYTSGKLALRKCTFPGHCTPYAQKLDDAAPRLKTMDLTGNANVEGPVIKDQLWYSLSLEVPFTRRSPNVPDTGNPFPGVTHPPRDYLGLNALGKLTWQPNESHNIKLLLQADPARIDNANNTYLVHPDAETQQIQSGFIASITDDFFVNDRILWTNRLAFKQLGLDIGPQSGNLDLAGHSNKDTGLATINDTSKYKDTRTRIQYQSIANYSLNNFLGEHQFKAGLEAAYFAHETFQTITGGASYVDATNLSEQSVTRLVDAQNTTTSGDTEGVFLQDMWKPFSSLTLRPGVRFDSARLKSYDGKTQVAVNAVIPRFGASWDPLGDGKTAVRAGYYQYVDPGSLMLSDFAGGKDPLTRTYNYNPVTGQYDIFQYESGGASAVVGKPYLKDAWNQQRPRAHEFIVGASREVMRNFKVSADFTYRYMGNNWEDTEENVIWDSTGTKVLGFKDGKPHYIYSLGALKEAFIRYYSAQFVVEKKFSDDFELLASYVYSRTQGTEPGIIGTAFDRPAMRRFEYGDLPSDFRNVVKLDGSYHLPLGFIIGGDGSWASGGPYNRYFFNTFYQDYGDRRAPRGQDVNGKALRMPSSYVLNLRASWNIKDFTDQDLQFIMQANNITNRHYAISIETRNLPDGSFGNVLDRMNPTSFTLGLRYRY